MSAIGEEIIQSGYLNPVVRDRLVNYYASDPVFDKVVSLVGFEETLRWYDSVSQPVYDIVQRSISLMNIADALAGKIIGDYFSRVSDIVARHGNILWFTEVPQITDASELFSRRSDLTTVSDYIMGTTTSGASRWIRFQDLLSDSMFVDLEWYANTNVMSAIADRINGFLNDRFQVIGPDLNMLPSDRGAGGRALTHWEDNVLRLNFAGDFSRIELDGQAVDVFGRLNVFKDFHLDGLFGGLTFSEIRDRLTELIEGIGHRDEGVNEVTYVGKLLKIRAEITASIVDPVVYGSRIIQLIDVMLGIDEFTTKLGAIRDKIKP